MDKKFIFLDIDGTLVDFTGNMPLSAERALRKAQQNGHQLILCTGRQLSQVYPWLLQKISFDGIVSSTGANVRSQSNLISQHCIAKEKLSALISYFRRESIPYCLQTEDNILSENWCVRRMFPYFEASGLSRRQVDGLFETLLCPGGIEKSANVEKVVYYDAGRDTKTVQAHIGADFQVTSYSFGNLDATSGEITQKAVNKATGMEEYLRFFGASVLQSVAVGDGDNDLEMVEFAHQGVAMGNATEALKNRADFIADSIDEDGLMKAFCSLGLIG